MATDTAAMAIAWRERARAALAEASGYRAQAEAFMERPDPKDDTWHRDMRTAGYRHLVGVADQLESYADRCREAAHACQQVRSEVTRAVEHYTEQARLAEREERRSRYDDSFDALHAAGTCRSPLCCHQTGTAS